ncbi:OPT/YSL family transporter [Archangium minus]|uniref:OPT/YSL family transporter n=1 Tax=Archangium minus TaxID=83450 RepID=UPI0037BEF922
MPYTSKMLVNEEVSQLQSVRVGALCGLAMVLLERWAPNKAKPFIPSPSSMELFIVIPDANSISVFIGTAIAEYLRRKKPQLAEATVLPVSSGFIVDKSLMGVAVAMLKDFEVMPMRPSRKVPRAGAAPSRALASTDLGIPHASARPAIPR